MGKTGCLKVCYKNSLVEISKKPNVESIRGAQGGGQARKATLLNKAGNIAAAPLILAVYIHADVRGGREEGLSQLIASMQVTPENKGVC